MQHKHSDPLAMMTPHICSAHVLFKALQTPRTGFPVVFKGGQKMQAILMRWKMQDWLTHLESHSCAGNKGGPETELCKEQLSAETNSETARGKLSWQNCYDLCPSQSLCFNNAIIWHWAANSLQHPAASMVTSACLCLSTSCPDKLPMLQERTRFPSSCTQDYLSLWKFYS